MNERQRFVFDTQGCVVLPDLLSKSECERLVAAFPRDSRGEVVLETPNDNSHHDLLEWEEPLGRELINHPGVVPCLEALLTDPDGDYPGHDRFFLEHEYTMYLRPGGHGPGFHFGGAPFDPPHAYFVRDGKVYCTLVTVVWLLNDVADGDGGFWYIPGSHHASFPMPAGLEDYSWVPDCAVQPTARAGSAIVFTEALVHGTRPWQAASDRYVLFYKYIPGYMALARDEIQRRTRLLTEDQKRYVK